VNQVWALYIGINRGEKMTGVKSKLEQVKKMMNEHNSMAWRWLALDNFVKCECPCWDCLIWSIKEAKTELSIL
tara:strand:+ start:1589 stop:1807 length:219 start_codon:yes stop_codon:yes gene_type:complete